MNLKDNPRYIKDITRYKKYLQSLKEGKEKIYFQKLIAQFEQQIQVIEECHNIRSIKRITPRETKANLEELIIIRQQLDKICKKF